MKVEAIGASTTSSERDAAPLMDIGERMLNVARDRFDEGSVRRSMGAALRVREGEQEAQRRQDPHPRRRSPRQLRPQGRPRLRRGRQLQRLRPPVRRGRFRHDLAGGRGAAFRPFPPVAVRSGGRRRASAGNEGRNARKAASRPPRVSETVRPRFRPSASLIYSPLAAACGKGRLPDAFPSNAGRARWFCGGGRSRREIGPNMGERS